MFPPKKEMLFDLNGTQTQLFRFQAVAGRSQDVPRAIHHQRACLASSQAMTSEWPPTEAMYNAVEPPSISWSVLCECCVNPWDGTGWNKPWQILSIFFSNDLRLWYQYSLHIIATATVWRSDLIYRAMLLLYIRSASQKPSNSFNVPTLRSDV